MIAEIPENNEIFKNESPFFESFAKTYGALPLHGIAAIPGKISGALHVTSAIEDAIPLIHGPVGCAFQRKVNPFRPYSPFYTTPCTNLNDMDVVYGGEEKLKEGIKETYQKYHPNLIVVITTCLSDLIGDDVDAVITNVKEDIDCDVVYSTGNFVGRLKPVGYQDALYAITDQMLCNSDTDPEKNEGSVNIVTYPIHSTGLKVAEMISVLNEMQIKVNKVCFDHTRVKDLYDLPKADLNITDYPMMWTRLMKKRSKVEYYEFLGWKRFKTERNPELISPYGIEGSCRIFLEIAELMGKDGEAEEVLKNKRIDAEERLLALKKHIEGTKIAVVGDLHGISLSLFKEVGVAINVLIYRTQLLEHKLSENGLKEVVDLNMNLAHLCGFDPEPLVNPTIDDEIKAIKRSGTDLVITSGTNAHLYNREGIRTFDQTDFVLHHQKVGFNCPAVLSCMLKNALKTPPKRSPLLSMLEYDPHMHNLTSHWGKLALAFNMLRSDVIGDRINKQASESKGGSRL
jgi:nitrogenase molybdenum-cofactor synthesis protein NifE